MSYAIVTDSSANLPDALIERYSVDVLSLVFQVEGESFLSYKKGEINDLQRFFAMMREKKDIKTSCIEAGPCKALCEELLKDGKDLLFIGFSSGLSATYQVGRMVLEELKPLYPERKIFHVDTLAAALGQGLLVLEAARQREAGKGIEEVHAWLEGNKLKLCHWFTVDDLFFLKRGGRVSAATAVLGSMLGIKPILHVSDEGKLVNVSKVRGRKASLDALAEALFAHIVEPEGQTIGISHGDSLADAEYLRDRLQEKLSFKDCIIHDLDPVIGAHSGPGTIALFFLGDLR
ncbi:MAG: DegV family protein [Christensenellaceae bacterium]|jgi:DegV family protein with EDD domain|nr:DegV family protein [Christensenellaceae bacterium]